LIDQYGNWVKQIREALEKWGDYRVEGDYRYIIVAGMGGSGIVGDYLGFLTNTYGGLPVLVYKNHVPPKHVGRDSLVIVVSYSGNTLETIRFIERISGSTVVAVSSGGLLEKISLLRNYLFIKVPGGYAPRTALPYMLYIVLGLLDSSGYTVVSYREAEASYSFLSSAWDRVLEIGGDIAGFIHGYKGLLILSSHSPYEPLLVRGKNEFNENSKIPVKVEVSPEWMHNDIVGWEAPYENKYSVLSISDPDDAVGSRLVEYMVGVYSGLGIPVYGFKLLGSGFLEKIMYGSIVLGVASVKLAYLRGLDPLATKSIGLYKEFARKVFV